MPFSPGLARVGTEAVLYSVRIPVAELLWSPPSKLAKIATILDSMGCFRKKEDEDDKMRKEANKRIEKQLQKDKQLYRATHRLLLLG